MANSILKQPSRMAVREYQPGDISTAISEGVSSRLEREEKKAKEIDYLHLLKTYGLAGMAQLGGQEFAKAVEDIKEAQIDYVEGQLIKNISSGKETSIIFYLKSKARDRGYAEKLDITSGGNSITDIKIEVIDTGKD